MGFLGRTARSSGSIELSGGCVGRRRGVLASEARDKLGEFDFRMVNLGRRTINIGDDDQISKSRLFQELNKEDNAHFYGHQWGRLCSLSSKPCQVFGQWRVFVYHE